MLARLLSPLAPHLAAEVFLAVHPSGLAATTPAGGALNVHALPWPRAHASWLTAATATVTVSVNGKLSFVARVDVDTLAAEDAQAAVLAADAVASELARKGLAVGNARRVVFRVTKPGEAAIVNLVM